MIRDRFRDRKMVFYGRVSTEHEAQLSALHHVGMADPGLRVGLTIEPNTLDMDAVRKIYRSGHYGNTGEKATRFPENDGRCEGGQVRLNRNP